MSAHLTLQRIRFCQLHFSGQSPSATFKIENWSKRAHLCYWQTSGPAVIEHKPNCLKIGSGSKVSSDTFFNAFYTGFWRKLTLLQSLTLTLQIKGSVWIEIFRHTHLETSELLASFEVEGDFKEFSYSFAPEALQSGLRLSFALTSRREGSTLVEGAWKTADQPLNPVRVSVGITTYNRQADVRRTVQSILEDKALALEGVHVNVVDQSEENLLTSMQGDRCTIIRQRNLGGAGGFSRTLFEAVSSKDTARPTHILLMDDDIELETDSILRVIRLAQFTKTPTLLGSPLLNLYTPDVAHGFGDRFQADSEGFYNQYYSLKTHLRSLHLSLDNAKNVLSLPVATDYCGWWFCLIPLKVVEQIGLPLPVFIKGDDVEYGLRAQRFGYASQIIAGLGIWHVPAQSKTAAWIRYVDIYNHLLLNALYEFDAFVDLFRSQSRWVLAEISKHRYQIAYAMLRGMEDFLGGWDFFRERTFPEHLITLKAEIAHYESNDKSSLVIVEEQSQELQNRLAVLVQRFSKEGRKAYESMKSILPKTTDIACWNYYFEHGNFKTLSDSISAVKT